MNCPKCNGPAELVMLFQKETELRGCSKCSELWIVKSEAGSLFRPEVSRSSDRRYCPVRLPRRKRGRKRGPPMDKIVPPVDKIVAFLDEYSSRQLPQASRAKVE